MSRRFVCVSCAERAATGEARVNDDTWQPVCSEACAQQMIGMPKRAAEDDAAQEMSPEERAVAVANNIWRLTVILERIVQLEMMTYQASGFSTDERLSTMTQLQFPERIEASIMTKSDVVIQLRKIRDFIIGQLAAASAGDVDFVEIRAQIATLINRIADDAALERYLDMQAHASWGKLIPADVQRLIARDSFPIRVVAVVDMFGAGGTLSAFRAIGDKLYALRTKRDYNYSLGRPGTYLSAYTSDGTEVMRQIPYSTKMASDELASVKIIDKYNILSTKDSREFGPHVGNIFAIDTADNTVLSTRDSQPWSIFLDAWGVRARLVRYDTRTASSLYDLIDAEKLHNRTALCAARNRVVVAVDRTNTVRAFDLNNNKRYTVATLPRVDSVAIDALQQVWIASMDTIHIFTLSGHRVAVDRIRNSLGQSTTSDDGMFYENTPFILSATDSMVWLGYSTPIAPRFVGLQLPPK